MNSEKNRFPITEAVYFDTNILKKLLLGNEGVDFVELRTVSKSMRANFFIPEISFKEWVELHKNETDILINQIKRTYPQLQRNLQIEPLKFELPKVSEAIVQSAMEKYINEAEIKVIQTPQNIQIKNLIEMSIRHIAPFAEKDKGFKDTLILSTIIEHMINSGFKTAIFLTEDKIFEHQDVLKRLEDMKLQISIVKSVKDAKDLIKKQVTETFKAMIEKEKQEILTFLKTKEKEIFDYIVNNTEVSEFFIKGGFLDKNKINGSIEKISAIRPKEISRVIHGMFSTKEKPPEEGAEPITFSVSVEFDLIVKQYSRYAVVGPRFSISTPEDFERVKHEVTLPDIIERTVIRDITADAWLYKENNKYSNLKIQHILTY
jgi:predicted nucleic acid-binding protein